MEPLNRVAAIIQPRLRVRILPVDSKVESSNMACLPEEIQPRRRGVRDGILQGAGGLTAPRRLIYGRSGARGAGLFSHPFIPIGTTVLV
jgi:hypothetical protein